MLPGGEKQRLAIARTLLSALSILLLDESTASSDGVNERLMREALDSVATGRTLIVIAHRPRRWLIATASSCSTAVAWSARVRTTSWSSRRRCTANS